MKTSTPVSKTTILQITSAVLFLVLGLFLGMNVNQNQSNSSMNKTDNTSKTILKNESPKTFTTAEASRPESILKSMYDAQLDCLNAYDINGVPVNLSSDRCLKMTNIYTTNNQNLKVNCSPQNTPGKQQIKINPATINWDTANIVVNTNWDGGTSTNTDVQLKLIDNVWRVASITCRN